MAVRFYECEGAHTRCEMQTAPYIKRAALANILEDEGEALPQTLVLKPFEIKTVILHY